MLGATQMNFSSKVNFFHSIPKLYSNLKGKTILEVFMKCIYYPLVRKSKKVAILVKNLYL